jgi:hypothetical protein
MVERHWGITMRVAGVREMKENSLVIQKSIKL